jgi:hypothetical protein
MRGRESVFFKNFALALQGDGWGSKRAENGGFSPCGGQKKGTCAVLPRLGTLLIPARG